MKHRIADHRGYITSQVTTGTHWNLPGHRMAQMKFTVLEVKLKVKFKVKFNSEAYRKERETYFINKFNTFYKGINKEK